MAEVDVCNGYVVRQCDYTVYSMALFVVGVLYWSALRHQYNSVDLADHVVFCVGAYDDMNMTLSVGMP